MVRLENRLNRRGKKTYCKDDKRPKGYAQKNKSKMKRQRNGMTSETNEEDEKSATRRDMSCRGKVEETCLYKGVKSLCGKLGTRRLKDKNVQETGSEREEPQKKIETESYKSKQKLSERIM